MRKNPIHWVLSMAAGSLMFCSMASAKVTTTKQGPVTTYEIVVEDVSFDRLEKNGDVFSKAKLLGVQGYEGIHYEPGAPELPVVRLYVEGEVEVQVLESKKELSNKNVAPLIPAQPSRVKLPAQTEEFLQNLDIYKTKSWFPREAFQIEDAGSVRGVSRKLVTLYPLRYSAGDNRFEFTQDFVVKATNEKQGSNVGPETFAFVVAEAFVDSPSLAAYEGLKQQQGYVTERVVVSRQDNSSTIRQALQDIYARTNLQYALIIGDVEFVPSHPAQHISGVTDHYYRAIDSDNYDSDINGPDIGVGRVSVQNEAQLATVLAKYTRYSQGHFTDNAWLNGAAFLATDDRYTVAEGSHNYAIETHTTAQGYLGVFPNPNEAGGDKLYAITHRVSSERANEVMQMGRTIINYSGHGASTFWDSPRMTQADVRALSDENAAPFVISNACITGRFTVNESFGETWQRHGSGAIMFWGSMDNTYWDEDDILERRMYDGIYALGKKTFREITQHALSEHWAHYGGAGKSKYYWETYVSFGDPSLNLRTTYQQQATLMGPDVLPIGMGSVSYKVADSFGNLVEGARVALKALNGDFVASGLTDTMGKVEFDIATAASAPGTFVVNVSGQNLATLETELKVVPSDTVYLAFSDYYFNDRKQAAVYAGEEVALQFTVTNFGQMSTSGSTVTLTSIEGPAVATGATTTLPALAGKEFFTIESQDLGFSVSQDANNGDVIALSLLWETNEGQAADVKVYAQVKKAAVFVTAVDFGLSGGAEGIAPGEAGDIYLTIHNTGGEDISHGILSVSAGTCLTGLVGQADIRDLASDEVLRLATPFQATVDANCDNGDIANFAVELNYDSVATNVSLTTEGSFTAGVLVVQELDELDIGLAIPDNADAVNHEIDWVAKGVIAEIGVSISITHSYIGDLTVELVHPDGTAVMLHNQEGGSTADLHRNFGLQGDALAGLGVFAGKRAEGVWKLRIQDHASSDTGTLNAIGLKIKGYLQ